MSLLAKMLGAFVAATNAQPAEAATNSADQPPALTAPADDTTLAYKKLLADDDDAQAEVDKMIRDNDAFAANGGGVPKAELTRRIGERLKPVRTAYENFLGLHPDHANARVAFGSFLNDLGEEDAAAEQFKKALGLDPKNPATWNNLANYYGEHGPRTNAFAYYAKAIELNPDEPTYRHNFGTAIYVFRRDAMRYFNLTDAQVSDKVLELYGDALRLDPQNFEIAHDIAQTYYGIKPLRAEAALQAWTNALGLAHDEIEREGIFLHLARVKLADKRFAEVHAHLDDVTNAMYADLKKHLAASLDAQEHPSAAATNPPPGYFDETNEPPRITNGRSWNTNPLPSGVFRLH